VAGLDIRFNQPLLLLVEGVEDKFFFKRLITERNLPAFKILHSGLNAPKGGNGKFAGALSALKTIPSFASVRHIVIVADNDADQNASFALIRSQLEARGHEPPLEPFIRRGGYPSMQILMLPLMNQPGNLETVCLDGAASANGIIAGHVDMFGATTHADAWPPQQYGKMWLRSYLAAACQRDPFVPLGSVFQDPPFAGLIDFQHPSFTPLAEILESYR
jgi:hypothetical protein